MKAKFKHGSRLGPVELLAAQTSGCLARTNDFATSDIEDTSSDDNISESRTPTTVAVMPQEVSDIKSFIEICRRKDASCTSHILPIAQYRKRLEKDEEDIAGGAGAG